MINISVYLNGENKLDHLIQKKKKISETTNGKICRFGKL